jgi:hypothetical protein
MCRNAVSKAKSVDFDKKPFMAGSLGSKIHPLSDHDAEARQLGKPRGLSMIVAPPKGVFVWLPKERTVPVNLDGSARQLIHLPEA